MSNETAALGIIHCSLLVADCVNYICGCIFLISSTALTEFNSRNCAGFFALLVESGASGRGGSAAVATSSSPAVAEGPHEDSVSNSKAVANRPEKSVFFMYGETNAGASYARTVACNRESSVLFNGKWRLAVWTGVGRVVPPS